MRQNAASSRRKKSKSKRNNDGSRKKRDNLTVDHLVASAESAMASLDVERAAEFYSQAESQLKAQLESSSTCTPTPNQAELMLHILEKMGECKVSMGEQEGAHQDFQQALILLEQHSQDTNSMAYHETRANLYLYTGQLCMGKEALEAYQKGVGSLEACVAFTHKTPKTTDEGNHDMVILLRQKLSGAYCTIAELFLTDLCYEDNAESECESYLEKALQIKDADGEPLVDALQTMASLRLSQKSRQLEAVPYILRAYDKMKVGSEALAALVGLGEGINEDIMVEGKEEATELKEVDAANNLPEFEFRCQTAKLLLECAALFKRSLPSASAAPSPEDQCLSAAVCVLGSLLAQNDEVIEIWFLTGCAFASKRPPLVDAAKFYLDRTTQMLQETKKALEQEVKFADQEELPHLKQQLDENKIQIEDVTAKLAELGLDVEGSMDEE